MNTNTPNSGGNGNRGGLIDGINITPMVDIILVILVIFMVTTTLVHERSLPVDLPETDAAATREAVERRLTVTVDSQGALFLSQESTALDLEGLGELLQAAANATPDLHVELRADRDCSYGEVIDVLGAIRAAGVESVGFAVHGAAGSAGTRL